MGLPVKIQPDQKMSFGNDTLADVDPHVAANPNGTYLIGWMRPVDANDSQIALTVSVGSGSITYPVNETPAVDEDQASVAGQADGNIMVVYRSTPDGGESDIRGRLLYSDRNNGDFSQEFTVNTASLAGEQIRPEVATLAYGRTVVAWVDTSANQIKAAVFYPGGPTVAGNITVSTTSSSQSPGNYDLGLAPLSNGNFVVSWLDSSGVDRFRIITSDGNFVTGDTATPGTGTTDVTELADGRILLTYHKSAGTASGHFGMIFDEDGAAVVPEFRISTSNGFQSVTPLLDGRFMVAYDDGGDLFGRVMNADGTLDSAKFRINTEVAGDQREVHLTTTADGRVVVAWSDDRTGGTDIYTTIYDPRESGISLTGTADGDLFEGSKFADVIATGAGNDEVVGNEGNDRIQGDGGNDVLYGEAGDDTLLGGAGNDYIAGELFTSGAGKDVLDGGLGADTMTGGNGDDLFHVDNAGDIVRERPGGGTADLVKASIDYTLAAGVFVELLQTSSGTGISAINLTGNEVAQSITGNAGANLLNGGGGGASDTLRGLDGSDTYRIHNTGDTIVETAGHGTDKAITSISYALGSGVSVEVLQTNLSAGTAAIDLAGNEIGQEIIGNTGANRIEGKGGADTLRGLGGADTFVFATKLGGGTTDTIVDFNPNDRFELSDAIFTALSPGTITADQFRANTTGEARDATDRIIYDTDSGGIFYDADGLGGAAGVRFAIVSTSLSITNADFVVV